MTNEEVVILQNKIELIRNIKEVFCFNLPGVVNVCVFKDEFLIKYILGDDFYKEYEKSDFFKK
jgi:ketopantoate reductase